MHDLGMAVNSISKALGEAVYLDDQAYDMQNQLKKYKEALRVRFFFLFCWDHDERCLALCPVVYIEYHHICQSLRMEKKLALQSYGALYLDSVATASCPVGGIHVPVYLYAPKLDFVQHMRSARHPLWSSLLIFARAYESNVSCISVSVSPRYVSSVCCMFCVV